jgi:dTDP-glucose 4,6-dehydratase
MKTVLVTGGAGFIGSHFVRYAHENSDLKIVNLDAMTYAGDDVLISHLDSSERYRFVNGDISDRSIVFDVFETYSPELVVNFAAESHVDRSIMNATPFTITNVVGTQTLLDAAVKYGVERYVQISTDEVYGDRTGVGAADESASLHAGSPYSASKASADLYAESYRRTHGLDVVITRCTNNFGPRQFPEKLIPLVIRNALLGKELPIYGDGMQARDWLYVEDSVRGLLGALIEDHGQDVINFGSGEATSNLDIVSEICNSLADRTGEKSDKYLNLMRHVEDRPGHDRLYAVSTERAVKVLNWEPAVDLASGMRETIDWYVSNAQWLDSVAGDKFESFYDSVYAHNWNSEG